MRQRKELSQRMKRLFIFFYVLVVLLALFTVASYTWFSLSRTPRVSDMYMFVNVDSGLEISLDPAAPYWELQLDFRDMVDETAPLRPVTWVDSRDRFYTALHSIDGRLTDFSEWIPLDDSRNANQDSVEGYYTKATFYVRSGLTETVYLSEAVEVDEGIDGSGTYVIGVPNWNGESVSHNNGGLGAECAVRIGLRITEVDTAGNPINRNETFYIYEPNSDVHIDGTQGYVATPSINQDANLVPTDRLILQSASSWSEAYPVQRDVVIHDLGEFQSDTKLFDITVGQIMRVDLYCWLEGQDIDCTNQIQGAQILASIQFATKPEEQSGMIPIE